MQMFSKWCKKAGCGLATSLPGDCGRQCPSVEDYILSEAFSRIACAKEEHEVSIQDFKAALSSTKFAGFLESMSISTEATAGLRAKNILVSPFPLLAPSWHAAGRR